jgi:hypothetical protein
MAISIATVFGRSAMNCATAADYVQWATGLLIEGRDSRNLRLLAGLDERGSVSEAEEHFTRTLRELQIPEPDTDGKLRAYAMDLAQQILDRELAAEAGVRALYQICVFTGNAEPYILWLYLDDTLDDIRAGEFPHLYPTATAESFDVLVRAEAQGFLDRMSEIAP